MIHPMTYSIMGSRKITPTGKLHNPNIFSRVYGYVNRVNYYYGGTTLEELKSPSRLEDIVKARQMVIFLIKQFTNLTTTEIGSLFNRDHTTVVYATKKIAGYIMIGDKGTLNDLKGILNEVEYNLIMSNYEW